MLFLQPVAAFTELKDSRGWESVVRIGKLYLPFVLCFLGPALSALWVANESNDTYLSVVLVVGVIVYAPVVVCAFLQVCSFSFFVIISRDGLAREVGAVHVVFWLSHLLSASICYFTIMIYSNLPLAHSEFRTIVVSHQFLLILGVFGASSFSSVVRLLHMPFFLVRYLQASRTTLDPFDPLKRSAVYWDELIFYRLPCLKSWLVKLVDLDRERGMQEIFFIASERPFQQEAARSALLTVAFRDLERIDTLTKLPEAGKSLDFVPSESRYVPRGLSEVKDRLRTIAVHAAEYRERVTPAARTKSLEALQATLTALRSTLVLVGRPVGPRLAPLAARWSRLVEQERSAWDSRLAGTIRNPFVVGTPLRATEQDVFKGRREVVAAIEDHFLSSDRSPALLLYGDRRIGKSSVLLNLSRLMSSEFVPVHVDLQDARLGESDGRFCHQLAAKIAEALRSQEEGIDLKKPEPEEFLSHPFSALGDVLDQTESLARQRKKRILVAFDEYEQLEKRLTKNTLTVEILNQIRNVIQHRARINVLLAGSHRFRDLTAVNWPDYLINTKVVKLGFLAEEEARELLTAPVPDVSYALDALEAVLSVTHRHPLLLQAIGFELVQSLNKRSAREVTVDDVADAAEKVVNATEMYFSYTWSETCSEDERDLLRICATNGDVKWTSARDQEIVDGLCRKEILKRTDDGHVRFAIELLRRWIVRNHPSRWAVPR